MYSVHFVLLWCLLTIYGLLFCLDVTIGFRVATVEVPESIGAVALIVEVKEGQLSHPISLQYSTSDGTATGAMLS